MIGIGGSLSAPPLPHHRTYGSVYGGSVPEHVILLSKTHFDTNHMLTIIWESADLKKAENALAATIRATLRAEAEQTDD